MTIFAGIYRRTAGDTVPEAAKHEIRRHVSRSDHHLVAEHDIGRFYVASVDIGAYGHSGVSNEGSPGLCIVAGDPILRNGDARLYANRSLDVNHLRERLAAGDVSVLARSSGTYAGVDYDATAERLSIFTDKVGVRQVFVCLTVDYVIFATALRILEAISLVPKRLSLKGAIEEVELHWPTGRRTPYVDIEALGAAEVFTIDNEDIRRECYWQWPEDSAPKMSIDDHLRECHEAFMAAIRARVDTDGEVLSFLSGGLDSRTIVAGLRDCGCKVDAINFAPPSTQDRVFAAMFSDAIGSIFLQMPYSAEVFDKSRVELSIGNFLHQKIECGEISPDRPRCIWGGNGGSVALGHVYLTDRIVEKTVAGDFDGAIALYRHSRDGGLARRPLTESVHSKYREWPNRALTAELEKTVSSQPNRKFYHFLMNNDQRRSLQPVYEGVDLHGLEYLLPFFDSEFLVAISRAPLEQCLYHGFYNKWLECFDDAVTRTPWQSYPGHEPSKVQAVEKLGYQFDDSFSSDWHESRRKVRMSRAKEMLASEKFPSALLSKTVIRIAQLFCALGSERLGYAIDKGYQYYRYASVSSEIVRD